MAWIVHRENIEHLVQNNPRGMRRYLTDMGDIEALILWDKQAMKDGASRG